MWETSTLRTRSSLVHQGTASYSMVMNLQSCKERGTKSRPTGRRRCLILAPGRKSHHPPMAQEMCPVQPARRGNLLSPAGDLPRLCHQRCPQTHLVGSLPAMANAPLHLRSSMTSVKRTHTVHTSSARTSLAVTGVAKTKKASSLHGSDPCLHPNGHLLLKG